MNMKQRTRWKVLIVPFLMAGSLLASPAAEERDVKKVQKSLFSPRLDYNQWKPLGRGDPLNNDPTFDYVPPVLDHVHYWMDPEPQSHIAAPDNGKKSEILLLGVSSKKPALGGHQSVKASDRKDTIGEPYSKTYQDKNFYNEHSPNQRIARPNYFSSMTSQIIPSLMSLANQVLDKTVYSKGQETRTPYTVLMPPPMLTKNPLVTSPMTARPFTPSQPLNTRPQGAVSIQESNLVYQSSSSSSQKEFEAVPSIGWELTTPLPQPTRESFAQNQHLLPPKSFIRIQFSPSATNYSNKILEASGSDHNINYVTPPPLDESKMTFKGQVSDDNDIADSYVKIEKPQAQMDHMGMDISDAHPLPLIITHPQPFRPPVDMKMIKDMETMRPPPITQSPVFQKPVSTTPSTTDNPGGTTETITTVTEQAAPTTTPQTLTTDPLFKHYKQPMEPIRGPFYLIIQGHSKVKTYKPAKQIDGVMVQETNEIPYPIDGGIDYGIKHLHGYVEKEDFLKKADDIAKRRQARTGNLQTLKHAVQTGLGAIDFDKDAIEMRKRSDEDLEETELVASYDVTDTKDATSEKYFKGIVEEARKLNVITNGA